MKRTRSPSSLRISLAMLFSLSFSLDGRLVNHSSSCVISMAATSEIVLPSILKHLVFSFRRVPWQTGHSTLSSMSSTIPPKETISDRLPSPILKSSSLPNMMWDMASSGTDAIGSNNEKPYFLAMERMTSNFLVSLIRPSGMMPPSAIDTLLSGIMVSIFTSTIIPSPLQCGQ